MQNVLILLSYSKAAYIVFEMDQSFLRFLESRGMIILNVHNVFQNLTAGSAFELNPSRRALACPPIICTIQYTVAPLVGDNVV